MPPEKYVPPPSCSACTPAIAAGRVAGLMITGGTAS